MYTTTLYCTGALYTFSYIASTNHKSRLSQRRQAALREGAVCARHLLDGQVTMGPRITHSFFLSHTHLPLLPPSPPKPSFLELRLLPHAPASKKKEIDIYHVLYHDLPRFTTTFTTIYHDFCLFQPRYYHAYFSSFSSYFFCLFKPTYYQASFSS